MTRPAHALRAAIVGANAMPNERIARPLLVLHWLIASLFVVALGAIVARTQLINGHPWRPVLRSTHIVCGQLIWVLALVRVAVRWRHAMPPAKGVPRWASWAGNGAHLVLYLVMLGQPLTGVLFMQAGDKTVSIFGWALPALVGSDKELHSQLKELHQTVGNAFYALIGVHVAAALWHHFWLKNETLRRMLRFGFKPTAPALAAQLPVPEVAATPAQVLAAQTLQRSAQMAADILDTAPAPTHEPAAERPPSP